MYGNDIATVYTVVRTHPSAQKYVAAWAKGGCLLQASGVLLAVVLDVEIGCSSFGQR